MQQVVRLTAGSKKYVIERMPFGWHQAPSLVQHLIVRILWALEPGTQLIIQYQDDLLFIDSDFQLVQQTVKRAAQVVPDAGYIIST